MHEALGVSPMSFEKDLAPGGVELVGATVVNGGRRHEPQSRVPVRVVVVVEETAAEQAAVFLALFMSVLQSCRHKGIRVIDIVTSILRAPDNTPSPWSTQSGKQLQNPMSCLSSIQRYAIFFFAVHGRVLRMSRN